MTKASTYICLLGAMACLFWQDALSPDEVQAGSRRECITCTSCGSTNLTAGDKPEDLKVHIVGPRYDTIEAFFRDELMYREVFPETLNLHCSENVALAPRNDLGTFAVRFGINSDTFKVYGWKKNAEQPESKQLTLEAGYPVKLTWVTTRILKVLYGPNQSKEYIVRFNDADVPWTELFR